MRHVPAFAVSALSAALFAGFLGWVHPAFDTFSHFRAHLAVMSLVIGLAIFLVGNRTMAVMLIAVAVASGTTTARAWFGSIKTHSSAGATVDVLQVNLRFDNPTSEATLQMIQSEARDVIIATEISTAWLERLSGSLGELPYRYVCIGPEPVGGAAIFSRHPFSDTILAACLKNGTLAIAAVNIAGRDLTLGELHLHWPWPSRQKSDIDAIASALLALPPNTLLGGDFNAVPWSATVERIARLGRLEIVAGLGGTWSPEALAGFRYFGLPIDQILIGEGLVVDEIKVLDTWGSDHRAIRTTVHFRDSTTSE